LGVPIRWLRPPANTTPPTFNASYSAFGSAGGRRPTGVGPAFQPVICRLPLVAHHRSGCPTTCGGGRLAGPPVPSQTAPPPSNTIAPDSSPTMPLVLADWSTPTNPPITKWFTGDAT
jgi:hypothetical protein